jgi:hypothetical protein
VYLLRNSFKYVSKRDWPHTAVTARGHFPTKQAAGTEEAEVTPLNWQTHPSDGTVWQLARGAQSGGNAVE